jgi:hypothetical protein
MRGMGLQMVSPPCSTLPKDELDPTDSFQVLSTIMTRTLFLVAARRHPCLLTTTSWSLCMCSTAARRGCMRHGWLHMAVEAVQMRGPLPKYRHRYAWQHCSPSNVCAVSVQDFTANLCCMQRCCPIYLLMAMLQRQALQCRWMQGTQADGLDESSDLFTLKGATPEMR